MTPPGDLRQAADYSLRTSASHTRVTWRQQGASFQAAIHQATGGGFPNETVDALWELVWAGLVTNDTSFPCRTRIAGPDKTHAPSRLHPHPAPRAPQRRRAGRWSLVRQRIFQDPTPTEWSAATARQLLLRNGIVMRETAAIENIRGGYASVYPVLKTMEESG